MAGCSGATPSAQNLCAKAKDLTAAVAQVQAVKPDGAALRQLSAKVDAALAKLDRLQAVTEGRYDTAISDLRAKLVTFKESVDSASNASLETVAPQINSALTDLRGAVASLNEKIATQCPAG
ncbi:hypothetical protein FBY41_3315 [Humibacillus xanthopallidus]|uniref:Uncharacterized protein n=1 Tax=Humibacillus xanthopallidus TaxID=412689 RepID=A0A543HI02_9MICO|nr:hypothetical protein FBY41_3315 [Humibacillus xanthopallidus]